MRRGSPRRIADLARLTRLAVPVDAAPPVAWRLYAEPEQWPRWAPHVRGARGLGSPKVIAGARGTVRLAGVLPVAVTIGAVDPGRSWEWRVGPVGMRHLVTPRAGGCEVALQITGSAPVRRAVSLAYGPLVLLLLSNLARVATSEAGARQHTQAR